MKPDDEQPAQNENRQESRSTTEIQCANLFAEYKQLFDLSCDKCSSLCESLADARKHYSIKHKDRNGYIKCKECNIKISFRCKLLTHLIHHAEIDKFKYVSIHR